MALCPTRIIVLWKVLLWFYQENLGPYPSEESWCSTTPLCDGGKPISFSAAMAMVLWTSCWDHQISWFFFAFGGKTKNQQGPKSRNARVFMCFLLIEMVKKGRSLSLSLWFFRSLAVRSLYGLTVTAKKEINTGWGLGSTRGFPRWLACWTCGFSMGAGEVESFGIISPTVTISSML